MNMHQSFLAEQARGSRDMQVAPVAPRVGLLNAYSTRNLGDAAIMSALASMTPDKMCRVALDCDGQLDVRGITHSADLDGAEQYISVGGDIFNNARPRFLTRNFVANVHRLRQHAERTIVFGQTIPTSCGWLGLPYLAAALRRVSAVVVRDRQSLAVLRRHGVGATLSHDSAFALSPSDCGIWAAAQLFAGHGLVPEKTAILSVRSFDSIYRHDEASFISRMSRLAQRLLERGHQVAILIQSDVNEHDTDRTMAKRIAQTDPRIKVLDLFEDDLPTDHVSVLIGALTIANVVVAVRYHAAILRLVGGRKPYNLYYSRKGQDLHERHSLPGCALEAFDPDAAIHEIEKAAENDFDVAPVTADVRVAFSQAFGQIS